VDDELDSPSKVTKGKNDHNNDKNIKGNSDVMGENNLLFESSEELTNIVNSNTTSNSTNTMTPSQSTTTTITSTSNSNSNSSGKNKKPTPVLFQNKNKKI
jgi:hypothetical protein